MIKRIKLLMQEFAMSENEFAKALSMSQSTLNGYTKETRKPSLALAESILNAFEDVSAEWLLRGEGEMYKTTELPPVDVSSEESIEHSVEIARLVREKNELIEKIEALKAKCAKLEELTDELSKENIAIAAQRDMAKDLLREYMMGETAQKAG
jgi:transcriptional regulator with XRE-family HTH domain